MNISQKARKKRKKGIKSKEIENCERCAHLDSKREGSFHPN